MQHDNAGLCDHASATIVLQLSTLLLMLHLC